MIHGLIIILVSAASGFGLGRIKNAKKLAVAQAELDKLKAVATKAETSALSEIKKVV